MKQLGTIVNVLGFIFLAALIAGAATIGSLVERRWTRAAVLFLCVALTLLFGALLIRSHNGIVTRVLETSQPSENR